MSRPLKPLVASLRWSLHKVDAALARLEHGARDPGIPPPPRRHEEIAAFVRSLDQPDASARTYLEIHLPRITRTLDLVPEPKSSSRALELGAYMHMTPALRCVLGY